MKLTGMCTLVPLFNHWGEATHAPSLLRPTLRAGQPRAAHPGGAELGHHHRSHPLGAGGLLALRRLDRDAEPRRAPLRRRIEDRLLVAHAHTGPRRRLLQPCVLPRSRPSRSARLSGPLSSPFSAGHARSVAPRGEKTSSLTRSGSFSLLVFRVFAFTRRLSSRPPLCFCYI